MSTFFPTKWGTAVPLGGMLTPGTATADDPYDPFEGYTRMTFSGQQRLLLNAMIEVESGGNLNSIGDNGNAIGGLQIWYVYWHDSQEYLGYKPAPVSSPTDHAVTWGRYLDCYNLNYAERMVDAYMKRFTQQTKSWANLGKKKPLAHKDFMKFAEIVARIHNGGPGGATSGRKGTDDYWRKIKYWLDKGPPPRPIQPEPLG